MNAHFSSIYSSHGHACKGTTFIFSLIQLLFVLLLLPSLLILPPNLSTMDHHKKAASFYAYTLDHSSTLSCAYAAATTSFAFLGEWLILVVTCSIALFFFPLTPAFTLHSTTASVLNLKGETQNHFTANLSVGILVDDSNPLGSSIYYDSLHVSIFQGQEKLSTFSLQHEPTKSSTAIHAKYPNVSVKVDEWGINDVDAVQVHGTSCGFVYLDLWFSANVRYMQPMWPAMRDKLQGHCGEVKVELCSSGTTTVFHSFLASCDVYSDVVHKVRLVIFLLLILLLVTAVVLPLILENFFCSSTLYFLES